MPARTKHRFWRKCRVYFRRLRISIWLVALALLCALIYLDLVGLPGFVKRPLLNQLRARGLDLEFSRLRLRWHHGIVADDVHFGRTGETAGPTLSARQVSLQLNVPALARFKLQVDALALREGRLEWPDDQTGASLKALNVENIQAGLRLLPGDEWSLDDFRAHFAGANFALVADITNASAIRTLKLPRPPEGAATNAWPQRLRVLADVIRNLSFSEPPEMRLVVNGDARDPQSFSARLTVNALDTDTPWGRAGNVLFITRLLPRTDTGPLRFEMELDAATVQTPQGTADKLRATAALTTRTNAPPADEALARWTNALPWNLDWNLELTGLRSEKVSAETIICAGTWRAPELAVTNLHADLGGGAVDATASLDVMSREARFDLVSDADPRAVEQLLTPKTRLWLAKYSWAGRPHLKGSGAVILPAWTNRAPDWRGEVRPTLRLAGEFAATNGAYLGVHADWARSHVSYTNMVWRLPDLQVGRPEGVLQLAHEEDDRTKDYHWHIRGAIDPQAVRPLLSTNQWRGFDLFAFNVPPVVEGDVWGRLYERNRIGFQLRVTATNFSVRGQGADTFESEVRYTNRFLEFIGPALTRGAQHMNASGVAVDFDAQRIYFTNGFSMAEPQVAANAIGPKTGRMLEPYHFALPPVVRVEGYAPLRGGTNADLRFAVEGGPFAWSRFNVPRIAGNVHWLDQTLLLTNVQMDFYGGGGAGFAFFRFEKGQPGTDFNFSLSVSNAYLQSLMADVTTHSNKLEGTLSGSLQITDASSTNWHSWNGLGYVRLRDGFIWEIPVFGVLAPALDGIFPGLGTSRVTDGRAGFVITNGVVYSDSVNLRSPLMRLKYEGTVDFDTRVNARVEAELFRDTWLFGRVLSAAFGPMTKLLEYKVKGTLAQPKPEPVYFVPKLLFLPLHPIRTIEEMFSVEPKTANAPPEFKPLISP